MRSLILVTCVAFVGGCFGSPSGFQKQDTSLRGGTIDKIVTKTTDGVTYAAMRADETSEQILEVNDIQELAGSSLSLPPGALAISVSMNVQEAAPLATTSNALELKLGTGFAKSGAPIVVQADKDLDLLKPMTISLPLPQGTQLMLADPYETLVVLYKVNVNASDEIRIGALLRSALTVSGNAVSFQSSYLGAYQVAYTEKPVQQVQEVPTAAPILTKKEEAKLLTVDVGYDKDVSVGELALDARTTSAVSFKWEKVSGPGDVTFGSTSAEDTKVSLTRDGAYVLRLTVRNDKDETARDEIAIAYDPWPIATVAVNLVNEAADGKIEPAERSGSIPILKLTSPEAAKTRYSQALPENQVCDASVTYGSAAPTAASLVSDGTFAFCVAFDNFGGKVYYAKSPVVTRTPVTIVPLAFTSLLGVNEATDGFVNASEISSAMPLVTLSASGYASVAYSMALADSALVCDASQTYSQPTAPRVNEVPSMDGLYAICVKLMNAAGEVVYAKSSTIERDTLPPGVNVGSDITVGASHTLNASSSGTATYQWTQVSGPGSVTFGSPTTVSTTVAASVDGAYVLRLTATDAAGNSAFDELVFTWNTTLPVFTALTAANEAADGSINAGEMTSSSALWTLSASNYTLAKYTLPIDDTSPVTCDGSRSYTETTIPSATSLTADAPWVICVKLTDALANAVYGKSQVIVRDTVPPSFSTFVSVNVGVDGYVNASEQGDTMDLWSITSADATTSYFVAVQDAGGTADCAMQSYAQTIIPRPMDLGSDGVWAACVKLIDAAGNVVYGKSATVIKDSMAPTIAITSTSPANMASIASVTASGTCSENGATIAMAFASVVGSTTCASGAWTYTADLSSLPDGSVTVSADTQDMAANPANASLTIMKDTVPPVAALGTTMPDVSDRVQWNIPINPADTVWYRVKINVDGGGTSCSDPAGYSPYQPIATPLNFDITPQTDGLMRLCLLAKDQAGNEQPLASPSTFVWEKATKTPTVVQVAMGGTHACALFANGRVKCWGGNGQGQLGYGDSTSRETAGQMGDSLPYVDLGPGRAEQVVAGLMHTCALLQGGEVRCWGFNMYGQLGQGDIMSRGMTPSEMGTMLPPTPLGGPAVKLSAGNDHTCALMANHDVKCWGANSYGQLGQGDLNPRGDNPSEMSSLPPVNLGTGTKAIDVAAGPKSTCAVLMDSSVKCWGDANNGKLGNVSGILGDAVAEMGDNLLALNFGTGLKVRQVAVGLEHVCALFWNEMYQVKCIGMSNYGQTGYESTTSKTISAVNGTAANTFVAIADIRDISVGENHSCALLANGDVKCWGLNTYGQLGIGSAIDKGGAFGDITSLIPVNFGPNLRAVQISSFANANCALLDSSRVKCWGRNDMNQLGNVSALNVDLGISPSQLGSYFNDVPTGAIGTPGVIKLVSGSVASCALMDGYHLKCWGGNTYGQLGLGHTMSIGGGTNQMGSYLQPVDLGTNGKPREISMGFDHACAVLTSGETKCWGGNTNGKLGLGDSAHRGDNAGEMGTNLVALNLGSSSAAPLKLSLGGGHACALFLSGKMKCWGTNTSGQLGLETTTHKGILPADMGDTLPYVNLSGKLVTDIAAGGNSTCAILDDRSLKCWGMNTAGQLGIGNTTNKGGAAGDMTSLPTVSLGGKAVAIAIAEQHACAILDSRAVKCWGSNAAGQLGNGSTNLAMTPTLASVEAGRVPRSIAGGQYHTCLVNADRSMKCWGDNGVGQLGQGSVTSFYSGDAMLPIIEIGEDRLVSGMAVRQSAACALTDLGRVKCWGSNAPSNPLGLGTSTTAVGTVPTEMGNGLPFVKLH